MTNELEEKCEELAKNYIRHSRAKMNRMEIIVAFTTGFEAAVKEICKTHLDKNVIIQENYTRKNERIGS